MRYQSTFEIHQKYGPNWEVIPEGEFSTFEDAEKALKELQKNLGWKNLKIVEAENELYQLDADETIDFCLQHIGNRVTAEITENQIVELCDEMEEKFRLEHYEQINRQALYESIAGHVADLRAIQISKIIEGKNHE